MLNFYPKETVKSDEPCVPDYLEDIESRLVGSKNPSFSLLLQPRSLLILQKEAYQFYLHGIQEVYEDKITNTIANLAFCKGVKVGDVLTRKTRISLTMRYVPKAIKASFLLQKR